MLSPAPTDKTAEMRQGVGPHGSAIRPWSSGKINTRGGSEPHSNRECGYCQRHRINRCFCAKYTGGASDQLGARDSRESTRVLDFSGNERSTASYRSLKP